MSGWKPATQEDQWEGAIRIRQCFEMIESEPFFVGRNGTIEIETLYFWAVHRRRVPPESMRNYPLPLVDQIQRNAGIFPGTGTAIDAWCEDYVRSLGWLNGTAAGWYRPNWFLENTLLDQYAGPNCFRCPLRSLEPYYHPEEFRWTPYLAGKKVAVVSSFADTIERQVLSGRAAAAWNATPATRGLLDCASSVDWTFVRTGYAPITALGSCGWPEGVKTWKDAVEMVAKKVVASGAKIALIGCGGLGVVLAGILRTQGVSCLILGGAVQVLFAIKGQRWEKHDVISKFWNEHWVWPAQNEVPGAAFMIEAGCYWSPSQQKIV